jgi:predicted acetyltransferase
MQDETIRLRQPAADELRAWWRPIGAAFAEVFNEAEFEHDRVKFELDRLIGAVDGESWVSTGGAYSFRLTVPGGQVAAAGITAISVAPSHRRRGILRQMMRWLLDQARERGEPVAILWASESAIYRRFGYGIGTLQSAFEIERGRALFLRPAEPLGRMRLLERDEAVQLIPPVYEAVHAVVPGTLTRPELKWRAEILDDAEWMRGENGPKFLAVLEVDRAIRGYAIYRAKSEWDERGPKSKLLVFEVVGLDPAAERAIWEWLFAIDLISHVKAWRAPFPHPLVLQLTEPRRLGLSVQDGLHLRLIDMPAALAARSYNGAGSLTFELTDEFCPWNAGRWRLDVPGDRGVATITPFDGDPDLTLDTSDLATVYLGTFTFADLARAGRLGESRPRAVAAADVLFATAVAPWCSTMF